MYMQRYPRENPMRGTILRDPFKIYLVTSPQPAL
jgi:hypothetical protein